MSKTMPRFSELMVLTIGLLFLANSYACNVHGAIAQSSAAAGTQNSADGFSVFRANSAASDSFTNPDPAASLSRRDFGVDAVADERPQLQGSKAIGTYASQGSSMFKQAPGSSMLAPVKSQQSEFNNKLQPFAAKNENAAINALRSERPQPDDETLQQPPTEVQQMESLRPSRFSQTSPARRLPPAAARNFSDQNSPEDRGPDAATDSPRTIAQVAFQDDGFRGASASQGNTGDSTQRFGGAGTQFGGVANTKQFAAPNKFARPAVPEQPQNFSRSGGFQQNTQPKQETRSDRFSGGSAATGDPRTVQSFNDPQSMPSADTRPPARMARMQERSQPQRQPQRRMDSPNKTTNRPMPNPRASNQTAAAAPAGDDAKAILQQWVADSEVADELDGRTLTLAQLLAQPMAAGKKDVINQYWMTYYDQANHLVAKQQAQWLASIDGVRQAADAAVLRAAQQAAENEVLATEIQLGKSQLSLQQMLPNLREADGTKSMVLPADSPWVGKLNTKFKEYQQRGIVPVRFNRIDDILPKSLQLIQNRASSVASAGEAAEQSKAALRNGQTQIANVLEAARLKSLTQRQLLSTVIGYNRAITDYVLSVRQDIYQPTQLASVLIGRNAVRRGTAVQKAAAEGLAESSVEKQGVPAQQASSASSVLQKSNGQDLNRSASNFSVSSPAEPAASFPLAKNAMQFGPTAGSAKAANFSPENVLAESNSKSVKAASPNPNYDGNQSAATFSPSREMGADRVAERSSSGFPKGGFPNRGFSNTNGDPESPFQSGTNAPASVRPPVSNDGFPDNGGGDASQQQVPKPGGFNRIGGGQ